MVMINAFLSALVNLVLLAGLPFLVPHLLLLFIMPEAWGILIVVTCGSLFTGWLRIKSGSILGPWLIHAVANISMGLYVAIRTVN